MEDLLADIDECIGGWMGEAPRQEWAVILPDGGELCRHASQAEAQAVCERLQPLLAPECRQALRVQGLTRWPSYVNAVESESAQFRFCHWAMRRLGHVTVFAFNQADSDAAFMVLTGTGQRAEGATLSAALLKLVQPRGNAWRE